MATTQLRDTTNRFLTLDRDALACVLGHLDAPSLASASASCKLFRDTTNSSALWRSLCVAERGSLAQLPAGIDWRKMAATIFPPERPSSSVSDYTLLVDFTHHDHPQLFTIETSDAFTDPAYDGEPVFGYQPGSAMWITTDEPVMLGRHMFHIHDKRVSRKQVEVRTDGAQIICTRLGGNASVYTHGGAEHVLEKDTPTTVTDGAILYLVKDPVTSLLQYPLRLTLASAAPVTAALHGCTSLVLPFADARPHWYDEDHLDGNTDTGWPRSGEFVWEVPQLAELVPLWVTNIPVDRVESTRNKWAPVTVKLSLWKQRTMELCALDEPDPGGDYRTDGNENQTCSVSWDGRARLQSEVSTPISDLLAEWDLSVTREVGDVGGTLKVFNPRLQLCFRTASSDGDGIQGNGWFIERPIDAWHEGLAPFLDGLQWRRVAAI